MPQNLFYRYFDIEREAVNEADRSAKVTLSTESPVNRWYGKEILLHGADNLDFSRLNSALMNHDPSRIVGKVINPEVHRKKARATIIFDDDDLGNMALAKVRSGSLRGVSIGYMIEEARELQNDEEWKGYRGPALIATRTSIYEASLTPIPADPAAGVGREATRSLDGVHIIKNDNRKESIMTREEIEAMFRQMAATLNIPKAEDIVAQVRAAVQEEQRPKYGCTIEEFNEIFGRAAAVSPAAQTEMASMLTQGRTGAEMQRKLLEMATTKTDARDAAEGAIGDGAGMTEGRADKKAAIRSFKQITDDDFFAGLQNPAAFAIN